VADTLKTRNFGRIILSSRGDDRFQLLGFYFRELGEEYQAQNPVYLVRTLPENVYDLSGYRVYETWQGGALGVLTQQLKDFSDFSARWYGE
jgi:hypothetical protein